jgi:sugar lactone lactonase YvrE
MNYFMKSLRYPYLFLLVICPVICFISCSKSPEGKLIITLAPAGVYEVNTASGVNWRYIKGGQIALVDPDRPKSVRVLTKDFYSACSPDISPDVKRMLFAAQQNENDLWQIWEMELGSGKYRKITDFAGNCTDPVFVPMDKLVFTADLTKGDSSIHTGYEMFVCKNDGSAQQQITFHPHATFATTILSDGRLLTTSRQLYPSQDEQRLMVIRPDGTKSDLFYKGLLGTNIIARSREADGMLYLVESDSSRKTAVISIAYNRPLHSRKQLNSPATGDFCSVFPATDGKLLVTYRENASARYEVCMLNTNDGKIGNRIFGSEDYDVVDIIRVNKHNRPKNLPSEVDMGVKTGLLLCQDVNFTGIGIVDSDARKATQIEVLGLDSIMGIVRVEQDGSFYLKILADQPFRIRMLDDNHHVINSASPWLWLRPNERRGFVGLQQDYETAPLNQVSLAIKKDPVIIPMTISEIREKEVELE